jgi:predicted nucleic acid-binding protein
MILDAATLLAYFDRDHSNHWAVVGEIELAVGFENLVVSPFVIAELEPIVMQRYGLDGWLATLEQLASGAWTIAPVTTQHLAELRPQLATGATLAAAVIAVLTDGIGVRGGAGAGMSRDS